MWAKLLTSALKDGLSVHQQPSCCPSKPHWSPAGARSRDRRLFSTSDTTRLSVMAQTGNAFIALDQKYKPADHNRGCRFKTQQRTRSAVLTLIRGIVTECCRSPGTLLGARTLSRGKTDKASLLRGLTEGRVPQGKGPGLQFKQSHTC